MTSERRLLGRIFPVLMAVVAVSAVVFGWSALGQRPTATGFIDLINLDGEYAVVVREVEGDADRSFISLFHARDGERWGGVIPRYAAHGDARTAIAGTSEVVAVRTVSYGQPKVFAYDARYSRWLGSVFPLGETGSPSQGSSDGYVLPSVGSLAGGGQAFEIFGQENSWTTAVSFDLEHGKVLWSADLGSETILRAWLRPDHLVLERAGALTLVARPDGKVQRIDARSPFCVTDTAVHWIADDTFHTAPLSASGRPEVQKIANLAEKQPELADSSLTGLCGTWNDRLILTLARPDRASAVVALDRAALARGAWQMAWHIDLAFPLADDPVARLCPDRAPLSGQLTRFVPLLTGHPNGLAIIDLDAASVAWKSPKRPSMSSAWLMSSERRHYLYEPDKSVLAVFDGTSLGLGAAVELPGFRSVQPRHIAGNRVWVTSGQHWAILDATSLGPAPDSPEPEGMRDIRSQLSSELGL